MYTNDPSAPPVPPAPPTSSNPHKGIAPPRPPRHDLPPSPRQMLPPSPQQTPPPSPRGLDPVLQNLAAGINSNKPRQSFMVRLADIFGGSAAAGTSHAAASASYAAVPGSPLNAGFFSFLINSRQFKEAISLNILGLERLGFDSGTRCFSYEYLKHLLDSGLERSIRLIFDIFFSQKADALIAHKIAKVHNTQHVLFGVVTEEIIDFPEEQKIYMKFSRQYQLLHQGTQTPVQATSAEIISLTDPLW